MYISQHLLISIFRLQTLGIINQNHPKVLRNLTKL